MTRRSLWLFGALLAHGVPPMLPAQDTVVVLRRGETRRLTSIARWAVDVFNASTTTRVFGDLTIDRNTRYSGDLAVYRGRLAVSGIIDGDLVAINADVELRVGAVIRGDVVVLGGSVTEERRVEVHGSIRRHAERVAVRRVDDRLELRERVTERRGARPAPRTYASYGRASIILGFEPTYNRVEGLPLRLGGRLEWRRDVVRATVRGYGIFRTAGDFKSTREDIGYHVDGSLRVGRGTAMTVGGSVFDVVVPTQDWPLERNEVGWGSLLWHRDYRDYFLQRGVAGYLTVQPVPEFAVTAGLARVEESSIAARDPWALFRRDDEWRANPRIDEGDYTLITASAQYDTRGNHRSAESGWYVKVGWERGLGDNVVWQPLPLGVRDPLPAVSYAFERGLVDLRRYQRIGWSGQLRLRAFWAGSLGKDPLPVQRRYSLGGPDPLNGYGFRAFACNALVADPARPGLCDRVLLLQAEYRGGLAFDWFDHDRRTWHRRAGGADLAGWGDWGGFWFSGPTLVLFSNAGTGWLEGDEPDELHVDVGAGIEFGSLGLYIAKAIEGGEPVRWTLRIERRF